MFLGHFGLAFASKKAVPAISLGMLFVAAQFADLLWPMLLLAGVERVDILVFGIGIAIYLRVTRAVDRVGTWALWGLLAFFLAIYAAAVFGPPPPSTEAIAWSGIAMWLFVAWGYWVDKHRVAT